MNIKKQITMLPIVEQKIREYTDMIIQSMETKYTLEITQEGDQYRITINLLDKPNSLLIGNDGDTLSSFQHIIRTLVHKNVPNDRTHFIIDIGRYRKTREDLINRKIPDMISNSVIGQGTTLVIVGLSSYERLIVHKSLLEVSAIQSLSVGAGNNRRLVVMPRSSMGDASGLEKAVILDFTKVYEPEV
jgi:spoIIIJ-associated protein